jgi:hypothetical protein
VRESEAAFSDSWQYRGVGLTKDLYLRTTTQHTNIQASSEIRTHDPNIHAARPKINASEGADSVTNNHILLGRSNSLQFTYDNHFKRTA